MVTRFSAAAAMAGTILSTIDGAKLGSNHKVHRRGDPTTDALLEKARPYKKGTKMANDSASSSSHRRLDENYDFDGSYNIKFSQCVDIKLFDEDLFDEDVIEYTTAGQIMSTKSYALFHVCQEDDCYYESEDDLYIVDLPTYVMNVASYHANVKSSYCGACATYYYDYCVAEEEAVDDAAAAENDDVAAGDDADAAAYYAGDDGVERKLGEKQRRAKSYIDCEQCEAYGCLNNGDDDGQQQDEDDGGEVAELIEDISQCLNTGLSWNDDDLYIGFMCSPYDGDGVELAIFLDNECTVYTSIKSFSDIPSWYIYNDEEVFTEAETYIKNAFTETTPCLYEQFGDPNYQNNDDAYAANDDGYQVNDYCSGIFQEGALAFNSCAAQNDDQNNGNQNDDDAYNFYEYDMNYDDVRDLDEVCTVLQQMEGEYYYHYDEENSGTWNEHSGGGSNDKESTGKWGFLGGNGQRKDGFRTSATAIFLYVLLAVSMVISVLFVVGVHEKKKRDQSTAPVYRGGRDKSGARYLV